MCHLCELYSLVSKAMSHRLADGHLLHLQCHNSVGQELLQECAPTGIFVVEEQCL
jgi:hypothetical protein